LLDPTLGERTRTTAFAVGLLFLAGCGFQVLDGLSSGSDGVSDAGSEGLADGDLAQGDASESSDAQPDQDASPDTSEPLDATDASAADVESTDANLSDADGASETSDGAPSPGKLNLPAAAVTESAHTGTYVSTNTVDGNLTTRWAGRGDGVWIEYDLGAIKTLTLLRLVWFLGSARIYTFDVLVSVDNANWTIVLNRTQSAPNDAWQNYGLGNTRGRYLRIVGHMSTVDLYANISETEIWGF
jgi:F5/8 type C domain